MRRTKGWLAAALLVALVLPVGAMAADLATVMSGKEVVTQEKQRERTMALIGAIEKGTDINKKSGFVVAASDAVRKLRDKGALDGVLAEFSGLVVQGQAAGVGESGVMMSYLHGHVGQFKARGEQVAETGETYLSFVEKPGDDFHPLQLYMQTGREAQKADELVKAGYDKALVESVVDHLLFKAGNNYKDQVDAASDANGRIAQSVLNGLMDSLWREAEGILKNMPKP